MVCSLLHVPIAVFGLCFLLVVFSYPFVGTEALLIRKFYAQHIVNDTLKNGPPFLMSNSSPGGSSEGGNFESSSCFLELVMGGLLYPYSAV